MEGKTIQNNKKEKDVVGAKFTKNKDENIKQR